MSGVDPTKTAFRVTPSPGPTVDADGVDTLVLAMILLPYEADPTAFLSNIRYVSLLGFDAVNDKVREDTSVRTGGESRSELTFADLTIARLGADTIFSFNKAGRDDQLDGGSVLLRVPKNSGGVGSGGFLSNDSPGELRTFPV